MAQIFQHSFQHRDVEPPVKVQGSTGIYNQIPASSTIFVGRESVKAFHYETFSSDLFRGDVSNEDSFIARKRI